MATENKEFDEGAFDNDDDGGEISDTDDVRAIGKSADPFRYRRRYSRIDCTDRADAFDLIIIADFAVNEDQFSDGMNKRLVKLSGKKEKEWYV